MDGTQNKAMIGSLLYLTTSKHDIMFSVCLWKTFQNEPREVHLINVKRIFRYLIRTVNLGLYFKKMKDFKLSSYCDADYDGDKLERKGTNGSCHFIEGNLVT